MNKARTIAIASLVLLLPATGWCQDATESPSQRTGEAVSTHDPLIEEVLELTGTKKQIQQVPEMVKSEVEQRQRETDPRVQASMKAILSDSYKADALYVKVVEKFKEKFNRQRLSTVLQFARSPLGKKMTHLEIQAATPEGTREIQKLAAGMKSTPPPKERFSLVQRLDEATGTTRLSLHLSLATVEGLTRAIERTLPAEKRLKEGQLEKILGETRAKLEKSSKELTIANFLYTYHSVNDEELKQYVQFAESDSGKWFGDVLSEGFTAAMAAAAEKAGNQMVASLNQTNTTEKPRYSGAGQRDPFRPATLKLKVRSKPRESLSPLERYELGQLKLVGIIWDVKAPKAMVEDATGLGYVITPGTPIGPNEGKVKAIKPTEVLIEETYLDFYGAKKSREVSIRLAVE